MALRNIVKLGDPVLNKTSRKVEKFDEKLAKKYNKRYNRDIPTKKNEK